MLLSFEEEADAMLPFRKLFQAIAEDLEPWKSIEDLLQMLQNISILLNPVAVSNNPIYRKENKQLHEFGFSMNLNITHENARCCLRVAHRIYSGESHHDSRV